MRSSCYLMSTVSEVLIRLLDTWGGDSDSKAFSGDLFTIWLLKLP